MFEGLTKLFSSKKEETVTDQEKKALRFNAFKKVFPGIPFIESDLDSVIENAKITNDEMNMIMGWAEEGVTETFDSSLESIKDRILVASVSNKPLE